VVTDGAIASTWTPMSDVEVTTWLVPAMPWHVRVHRIRTRHPVQAVEGGFSLPVGDADAELDVVDGEHARASATTLSGMSAIHQLHGGRAAFVVAADPNTNIMHSRCAIPTLGGELASGEHWLACAVVARPATPGVRAAVAPPPSFAFVGDDFVVRSESGHELFRMVTGCSESV
jgi:hypothetical protein